MKTQGNKAIQWAYVLFWLLLVYIVASQLFWFISLINLNNQLLDMRLQGLNKNAPDYTAQAEAILRTKRLKQYQYTGEGAIVLLLILAGALYVYYLVRKQLKEARREANFLMAITHELKTPIAVAKLNLETLLRRNLDEETKQRLIQNSLSETNRLNDLSNNLLLSSQLESNRYLQNDEVHNFSEIVGHAVSSNQQRWAGREIIKELDETLEITGDKLLLEMLVTNLVENALKYSPKGKPVIVKLERQGQAKVLSVADEGPGIPDDEKKKVFEKHYRVGNEATKRAKGTGLGLFLVDKILGKVKASAIIEDNTPQGTIFKVIF